MFLSRSVAISIGTEGSLKHVLISFCGNIYRNGGVSCVVCGVSCGVSCVVCDLIWEGKMYENEKVGS